MAMDVEAVAREVRALLLEAAPASVITVHTDGSVYAETPRLAAIDRKRKNVATFTAKQAPPSHADIVDRLRIGLRKEFRGGSNA